MAALQDGRDGMFAGAAISRPKAFHWGVVAAKEGGEHTWVFVGRDDLGAPARSVPNFAAKDGSFFSRARSPAASDFLDGQKVTKEPPGGELRMAAPRPYSPTPWTPIYGGYPFR